MINNETMHLKFSDTEFSYRYSTVREAMQDAGLSALILYSTISSYHEVLYLSDFLATRDAFLVFPIEGDPTLFVQMFNHVPNARQVAKTADVRWGGLDSAASVAEHVRQRNLEGSRIGLVGPITFKQNESLKNALPQATFIDFTPRMSRMRLVKSAEEIDFLRRGAELSDRAIEALEREARPGITEHQLTAIVEEAYLGLGGKTHIHYMGTTSMSNPSL